MNRAETEWLREQEDIAYKCMRAMQRLFTRNSAEFREARAKWYAYYRTCIEFNVPVEVQDNGSRT